MLECTFWIGAISVGNEQLLPFPSLVLLKAKSEWQHWAVLLPLFPSLNWHKCQVALAPTNCCCTGQWPEPLCRHTRLFERKQIVTV